MWSLSCNEMGHASAIAVAGRRRLRFCQLYTTKICLVERDPLCLRAWCWSVVAGADRVTATISMRAEAAGVFGVALVVSMVMVSAQRGGTFAESRDHPAIRYSAAATSDPVSKLAAKIQGGQARLPFDPDNGYLRGVLDTLRVPIESQVTVFSGAQQSGGAHQPAQSPRALFQ